jgi:murein DD-endopeptidase MepM/ murein hydrolase activator NlpD
LLASVLVCAPLGADAQRRSAPSARTMPQQRFFSSPRTMPGPSWSLPPSRVYTGFRGGAGPNWSSPSRGAAPRMRAALPPSLPTPQRQVFSNPRTVPGQSWSEQPRLPATRYGDPRFMMQSGSAPRNAQQGPSASSPLPSSVNRGSSITNPLSAADRTNRPNIGFYDSNYPKRWNAQHSGVDLFSSAGATVRAPVDGHVVMNMQSRDINNTYVIVQQAGSKTQYVLGHVASNLLKGESVSAGQSIGTVRQWPKQNATDRDNSHVHFGKNVEGRASPEVNRWGWGRAPRSATREELRLHGWVAPDL